MIDLAKLKDADAVTKPAGAGDWLTQAALYDDASADFTKEVLETLKVGIEDNKYPVQVAMIRRIVDRLAVIYDRPPSRWLVGPDDERLPEDGGEHKDMHRILGRNYNLAWRTIDRRRSLQRQTIVRFYPSDTRLSVVLRTFDPYAVMRDIDPAEPDVMDADYAFALNIGSMSKPVWETWERLDDGKWSCVVIDDEGELTGDQPYAETNNVCPYSMLPVQIIYDEWPDGRAWLPPRSSRTTWSAAINAVANDLWSLAIEQAHSEVYATADDASDIPDEHGHTVRPVLDLKAKFHVLEKNPKISECLEILEAFSRLWVGSEDLPIDEFQRGRQVVTGAALKVQEAPLMARREALVEQAPEDEAQAWRRFRAVHNVHAKKWKKPKAPDFDLDLDVADVNQPDDPGKLQEGFARGIAMGTRSPIEAIMAERGVNRARAIKIRKQIDEDLANFPPPAGAAAMAALVSGPKPASTDHQNPSPTGSTVQAVAAMGSQGTDEE